MRLTAHQRSLSGNLRAMQKGPENKGDSRHARQASAFYVHIRAKKMSSGRTRNKSRLERQKRKNAQIQLN